MLKINSFVEVAYGKKKRKRRKRIHTQLRTAKLYLSATYAVYKLKQEDGK
jgi:hypothetical protein